MTLLSTEEKAHLICSYAELYGLKVLVETGSYIGNCASFCGKTFDHIFTIELDEVLYEKCRLRFAGSNVFPICGNSIDKLPFILSIVNEPCVFWLDAHYSGVTDKGDTAGKGLPSPITAEIGTVLQLAKAGFVLLIDDARLFNGKGVYPALSEVLGGLYNALPDYKIKVEDDIIQAFPEKRGL